MVHVSKLALTVVLVVVTACSSNQVCTAVGAESAIFVDTSALDQSNLVGAQVCIDDYCEPVGKADPERPGLTLLRLDEGDDDTTRTMVIGSVDGMALAGPQEVTLDISEPNGPRCSPRVLVGSFAATADGRLEPVLPR